MSTPTIRTRKPTGMPTWPTALLAGVEGSGKSVRAALASGSSMVHRTFWIGCGEDDPDEYGIYEGVRFEIVEHDGTYRGLLGAAEAAAAQEPGPSGEPNLIVIDSGSRFWNMLHDMATETMIERLRRRAGNSGRPFDADPATLKLTPDLWNTARDRWYHLLDTLRYDHQGPVIITSRLKMTTVFENGEPTKAKEWDQKAQFDLPYDVGLYVQMRASYPARDDWLIRVKSARYKHPVDEHGKPKATPLPDEWSMDWLWQQLGLAETPVAPTAHHQAVGSGDFDTEDTRREALLEEIVAAANSAGVPLQEIADEWARAHNGQIIQQTGDYGGLELLRDDLRARLVRVPDEPQPQASAPAAEAPQEPSPARQALDEHGAEIAARYADVQAAQEAVAKSQTPEYTTKARVEEAMADLYRASTLEEARKVWTEFADVRQEEVVDVRLGAVRLGRVIMERQRELAGAGAPADHGQRAAGELSEPVGVGS